MIVDQPYELRNALFTQTPPLSVSNKISIVRDVILCAIIAGIGLMGTYYLLRAENGQSTVQTIQQMDESSLILSTKAFPVTPTYQENNATAQMQSERD